MVQESDNRQSVVAHPSCQFGQLLKHRRIFTPRVGYREFHVSSHFVNKQQQSMTTLRSQSFRAGHQAIQNRLYVVPSLGLLFPYLASGNR